jgi:large subunit ribosomal protein L24
MALSKTVTRVKVKPRIRMSVRKNDEVVVIAGKDRGKRGRVLQVLPERNRVVVEGVNVIKRHTKANPQKNVKGGIVERAASIHASNVQPVDPNSGKATRVGRKVLDDNRRVRIARRSGELLDK